ncbi:hypothetical protein ACLB2K_059672 [Fragaria x ananassa]
MGFAFDSSTGECTVAYFYNNMEGHGWGCSFGGTYKSRRRMEARSSIFRNMKCYVSPLPLCSKKYSQTSLQRVSLLFWEKRVAVADIVGEALNVLVLQDFKEHKWSNITLPLVFLKDDPVLKDQILKPTTVAIFGQLEFYNAVRENILVYDMKQEMIKATLAKSREKNIAFMKPSLVALKGIE